MAGLHKESLVELHGRLMKAVRSEGDGLGKLLEKAIANLGWFTQEMLTNAWESAGCHDTALKAACRLGKQNTILQLLRLQATPSLEDFSCLMTNPLPATRPKIADYLLSCSPPQQSRWVFWLACFHNDVGIAATCLQKWHVDANVPIAVGSDRAFRAEWAFDEDPLPIQYAAYRGHQDLLKLLEPFHERNQASELYLDYLDYLLLAAYKGHRALVDQILRRRKAPVERCAQMYEVMGASEVIANNPAVGKSLWKKAIAMLEAAGVRKGRSLTEIIRLEPSVREFCTSQDIEAMRAKELRIQALNVMHKYLGKSFLFVDALLRRDYSKSVSVFALQVILETDNLTQPNLELVEASFERLGFFLFPELELVTKCLRWCIRAAGYLRFLLSIQPRSLRDLSLLSALAHFSSRVLLSVEGLDLTLVDVRDEALLELHHELRRIVAVFQPLAADCSLLERLEAAKSARQTSERNIFEILARAGADLVVLDSGGNVVRDFATELTAEKRPLHAAGGDGEMTAVICEH